MKYLIISALGIAALYFLRKEDKPEKKPFVVKPVPIGLDLHAITQNKINEIILSPVYETWRTDNRTLGYFGNEYQTMIAVYNYAKRETEFHSTETYDKFTYEGIENLIEEEDRDNG